MKATRCLLYENTSTSITQIKNLVSDILIAKMAASYTFEDLSGATPTVSDNPYDGLIEACHNKSASSHRIPQWFQV